MRSVLLLFLATLAGPAFPQGSQGYLFVAPGRETSHSSYFHAGVGAEWVSPIRVGLGGEIGYLGGRESASGLAVLSGNGSYHIPVTVPQLDPFATLGVTLITNFSGSARLFNWGGGANYWLAKRVGARFEFRDHVWRSESTSFVEFRFGVSLR